MNDPTPQAVYSLDILAEITGVSTQTILEYQEHGLIRPELDEDSLRVLRRIEHLRESCQVNLAGLKVLTSLLEKVEQLNEELRMLQK
ncbi:MAG: MerR family transcriptional regulator [Verrucomicrobia bacterium]|jgi:DNA-binding transcriptional MerR regulator|nr:MerR family transcriptional regulator [Verrucomicrobiota bacterium]